MKLAFVLCCVFIFTATARARRQHQVTIAWTDSNPPGIRWDVYRASGSCVAVFSRIAVALSVKTYVDRNVSGSGIYCYYVAATINGLSAASGTAIAVIPR